MLPMHSHCRRLAGLGLLVSALLSPALHAQPADAAKPAPALSDADRAKRDADKVSQWIRLVADKAAAKAAPAPAPAAPAARKASPPPAPAPSSNGATLAAARKQVEALTETSASAVAPPVVDSAPVSPDPGTRIALAPPVAPPQAPAPVEEPEVPLKLVSQVQPEFPRQLVNTLQSGMVAVRFTVRPDGSVSQAEALSSSHKRLSQAAIDAVRQWRFAPIKQERTASVEVGFKLE